MHSRLYNYLSKCEIITNSQYGFRTEHSTFMAQIDLYDKISETIDAKQLSMGIFIDLKKAFDTVNSSILISKLEYYGIRGIPLDWFKSYMSNRFQTVHLHGVFSKLRPVTCGVPQGSILGPLLFILYINDMVNCSNVIHFIIYADDTTLLFRCSDLDTLISVVNVELYKLSCWFKANMLSLNVKKLIMFCLGTISMMYIN